MSKIKTFIHKYWPTKRRLMQLYFALLFNANVKGFVSGRIFSEDPGTKFLCAPGINCYSCPGAITACPLGSLQGSFDNGKSSFFYAFGILMLYAIMLGRMICGWLCPFGLIQDLLYKIKSPKLKKSPVTRILSYMKYVILVFFVVVVPVTYAVYKTPTPAFCKYICPAGIIEGALTLLSNKVNASSFRMLGPLFTWKFLLMVSIVVGCVFIYRVFCRFICPLGGLYGLFNKVSFLGVKVDEEKCTHCNLCVAQCKVDIKHVGDQECISCGECIGVCPTQAISWKGPKILLKANEIPADQPPTKTKNNRLMLQLGTAVLMIGVLAAAIIYAWTATPPLNPAGPGNSATTPGGEQVEIEPGSEVGQKLPGSQLPIITKDAITEDTFDPTSTGKITVINFWGTWCGPCVKELPDFDRIATEYADTVTVVAVHTDNLKDEAPGHISEHFAQSNMIFLLDNKTKDYYNTCGGTGSYPHTVIIDENGVVIANIVGATHYEELKKVIDRANAEPVEQGFQVGQQLPGSKLPIITKDAITEDTFDPTSTGKITVINFWGTWCGPCVKELPDFDRIATEYADTVTVVAVHTDNLKDEAPGHISQHFAQSNMIFLLDNKSKDYFNTCGGTGSYPHTVIIDEDGIVIAYIVGATHYEELKQFIDAALAK